MQSQSLLRDEVMMTSSKVEKFAKLFGSYLGANKPIQIIWLETTKPVAAFTTEQEALEWLNILDYLSDTKLSLQYIILNLNEKNDNINQGSIYGEKQAPKESHTSPGEEASATPSTSGSN